MIRALILGGTADASLLAAEIARAGIDAVYSYGGRTRAPADQPLPTRIGGFGGVSGLTDYIRREGITHVIDATHPFAAEMSRNAVEACAQTGTPLLALERAPWIKAAADTWLEVVDVNAAVAALPDAPANVFLAIGRQHIAPFATKPQHAYTLRFVDPPEAPLPFAADVIVSRGPFTFDSELEMLRTRGISWIVARNSGGDGARAKIDAARRLGLPVIMISRPELPERRRVERVTDVMQWLGHSTRLGA
ncbi:MULTISPECIES: cobalt-precorrin-6A reductase [unclassified Bradyrhizobium]|uniref:cobalt-precorrin-6A reductase n=1 Tax=unclassified Bradyrhizobium TaxID=2631580 RepID=UPI00230325B6|nr:cobalt-precorrin-6A reductase [Bradyrhizobium sp. CCBAU 45321]MDA9545776.1 cobalt-precorrin-6X reductase [Bradyrhizobium sp. CCBAU 45321]